MEHTPEEVEKEVARLFGCATAPELLMPREALVDSTIQLLRDCNMVLIRAPPQTGKSTLAQLISRKVFTHHPDLEPVFFFWPAGRANYWEKIQDYREILKEQLNEKKVENESVREKLKIGTNVESSSRKPLYIIDDAHRTYSENLMWEQKFKNGIIDHDEYYLFLCGYGPANGHIHWGTVPSQSATVPTEWRIELLPHPSHNLQGMMQKEGYADTPHMLHVRMLEKEAAEVIKRWAENQSPQATYDSSVLELLWYETEGHPGALKLILELMESKGPMVVRAFNLYLCLETDQLVITRQRQTQHDGQPEIHYDATWCRSILGESLLAGLPLNARGYWNNLARAKIAAEDLSFLQNSLGLSLPSRTSTKP